MEQTRDSKGRFKAKRVIWTIVGIMVIVIAVSVTGKVERFFMDYQAEFRQPEIIEIAGNDKVFYEKKIETLKQDVLDRLAKCETDGTEDPDGAVIFDSNDQPSIGRFQFQRKTIRHYTKEFEGRDITNSEAIAIAIDPDKAGDLVEQIIFDNGIDPVTDWHNCSKKLGLSKEVEIINKLTK